MEKTSKPKECCGRCRFGLAHEIDPRQIYCRRNPPQHTMANVSVAQDVGEIVMSTQWQFPLMFRNGWCGEFRSKGVRRG
jgi:hypothetical protein